MIPYPSLEEQAEIALKLDKVSRIIEARKEELEKLDELIKARFVELFGDPVSNSKELPIATLPELGEFGRGVSKHRPRNDPSIEHEQELMKKAKSMSKADLIEELVLAWLRIEEIELDRYYYE